LDYQHEFICCVRVFGHEALDQRAVVVLWQVLLEWQSERVKIKILDHQVVDVVGDNISKGIIVFLTLELKRFVCDEKKNLAKIQTKDLIFFVEPVSF
jgi:hypothetical protein